MTAAVEALGIAVHGVALSSRDVPGPVRAVGPDAEPLSYSEFKTLAKGGKVSDFTLD